MSNFLKNKFVSTKEFRIETLPNNAVANKLLPGINNSKNIVKKIINEKLWDDKKVPAAFGPTYQGRKISECVEEEQPTHTLR